MITLGHDHVVEPLLPFWAVITLLDVCNIIELL